MKEAEIKPTDDILYESRVNLAKQQYELTFSFISPILFSILMGIKSEWVQKLKGIDKISLSELARIYREGDGDCGISFEYSIHSEIKKKGPLVIKQIGDALTECGLRGNNITSILLGFEKSRILQINTELLNAITEKSILFTDNDGHFVNLYDYIDYIKNLPAIFRSPKQRNLLPNTINGLWKADLLLGYEDTDMWAAASVKINYHSLIYSKGIAIGIVPAAWSANVIKQRKGGMVVCPLLCDNGFMQYFYSAWRVVSEFIKADAKKPPDYLLYSKNEYKLAEYLETQREKPVMELVDDIFAKLIHKSILLPKEKHIITADVATMLEGSNSYININNNSTIITPNIISPKFLYTK